MQRRHLFPLLLLPVLPLAGCATPDPAASHLGGFGDGFRGAALSAPWGLDRPAQFAGHPAAAARAAVQLEVVSAGFREDPIYSHEASGPVLHATGLGRAELRRAIGIAPDAPADIVVASLRRAAAALDEGAIARAEAALTGPAFPGGGAATLARLNALPASLPRTSEAGGAVLVEMRRIDHGGRGRGRG